MRVNNKQDDPLRLHQENIKEVDKFVYLGSVVSKGGGTDENIKNKQRQTCLQHLETNLEINCSLPPQKD